MLLNGQTREGGKEKRLPPSLAYSYGSQLSPFIQASRRNQNRKRSETPLLLLPLSSSSSSSPLIRSESFLVARKGPIARTAVTVVVMYRSFDASQRRVSPVGEGSTVVIELHPVGGLR